MTNLHTCLLAGATCCLSVMAAQADMPPLPELSVEVLDHRVLPQTEIDGLKFSELSALAYNPQSGALYGVSDKAILFRIGFAQVDGKITELAPQAGWRLQGADGAALKSGAFNPEGAHLRADGSGLLIVSENGPRAALFDLQGIWQEDVNLPAPLRDASLQRSEKDGLESLADHPVHGLLSATEEPQAADARTHHTIHAADGSRFAYDTDDIGKTNIKSLTTDPEGRLLVLERHRVDGGDVLQPYLRLIDPAACQPDGACPSVKASFSVPGLTDADFEGMTELGNGLYLIVSDDKINGEQRSVFALLRVSTE